MVSKTALTQIFEEVGEQEGIWRGLNFQDFKSSIVRVSEKVYQDYKGLHVDKKVRLFVCCMEKAPIFEEILKDNSVFHVYKSFF